jgi:hypothetical protein
MMCLDIYLSSLSKKEYEKKIKRRIQPLKHKPYPLMCCDIFSQNLHQ